MKKTFFLVLTVLSVLLLGGCQDEIVYENKSPGEKIGEQIMELAKKENISHMSFANSRPNDTAYPFTIKGEIIAVDTGNDIDYYNLNYVQHYYIGYRPSLASGTVECISIWFINP
jgi:hypothetical protein